MSHIWSHNKLTIAGPAPELRRFRLQFEHSRIHLDFAGVFPEPCQATSYAGITRWREERWGFSGVLFLKFPAVNAQVLEYELLTRPGPPIAWVKAVAGEFPALSFELVHSMGGIRDTLVVAATVMDAPPVAGHIEPVRTAA